MFDYVNPYGGMSNSCRNVNNGGISPTKQSIKDYVALFLGANSVEVVDEFDTIRTRHICPKSRVISILDRNVVPVPTTLGIINVEVFACPNCRKIIINKGSMEIY